jgi:hypothetical protein
MIAHYVGIAALTVLILRTTWVLIVALRQQHFHEIYAIWFAFSLFFLIFFALYIWAEKEGKEITDALGPFLGRDLEGRVWYANQGR